MTSIRFSPKTIYLPSLYRGHENFEKPFYTQHDYWTQVHQWADPSIHSRKRRDEDRHYLKRSQSPIQFEDIDDRPFSRNSNRPELRASHIGVLSSKVEDPPFLAETHRRSFVQLEQKLYREHFAFISCLTRNQSRRKKNQKFHHLATKTISRPWEVLWLIQVI